MTPQEGAQDQGNGDKPDVYTMRQLNQRTASVINRVIEKNGPALITRLGRFVAVIMPLEAESRITRAQRDGPGNRQARTRRIIPGQPR